MDANQILLTVLGFLGGVIVKSIIDNWVRVKAENRQRVVEEKKERNQAHSIFLESLVAAMDDPTPTNLRVAKEKFSKVELNSSKLIIQSGALLLQGLEMNSKGIVSSTDWAHPVFKDAFLEMARADRDGEIPDLDSFMNKLSEDPFFALMFGKDMKPLKENEIRVLLDVKRKPDSENS